MTKEHALHELVHTLSPAEKRYFKLYAQIHANENKKLHEDLFDAVNGWKREYNETEFKLKHKNKAFIAHFAFHKHNLYKTILKASVQFSRDNNLAIKFHGEIQELEFLASKNLLHQYTEKLEYITTLVTKRNNLIWQLMLHLRKRNTLPPKTEMEAEAVYEEAQSLLNKLQKYIRVQYIVRTLAYSDPEDSLTQEEMRATTKKMEALYKSAQELLKEEEDLTGELGIGLIFATQIFLGTTKHSNALPFCLDIIQRLEKNENVYSENVFGSVLANTLKIIAESAVDAEKSISLFFEIEDKLRKIHYGKHSFHHKVHQLVCSSVAEILLFSRLKQYEKCIKIVEDLEAKMNEIKPFIPETEIVKILLLFIDIKLRMNLFNQVQSHIREAIRISSALNDSSLELKTRIRLLLNVIVTDNFDKLDSTLRMVSRFIKQNNIQDPFYIIVLRFGKAVLLVNPDEIKRANTGIQKFSERDPILKELINNYVIEKYGSYS